MSRSTVTSPEIRCPYWLGRASRVSIRCEGFVDGTEIRFDFDTLRARKSYEKAFCCRNYHLCPICKACDEDKYDE